MVAVIIGFWVFENFYTPGHYSEPEGTAVPTVFPASLLPESTTEMVVAHQHFTLSYNEPFEQAEWVAYTLKPEHLTMDERERPFFLEDPKVKTKSADWRNYKGSGYDRGHLCPAGDRRFSEYAYRETFYTSNIVPQENEFNAGIWNSLEQQVRYWCKRYGTIYVITGGILEGNLMAIGDEDVAVPEYFYKIIVRGKPDKPKLLCFLLPHEDSAKPLEQFLIPVDELEALTGIDFFQRLPEAREVVLEKTVERGNWKF